MKISRILVAFSVLIGLLVLVSSFLGIFYPPVYARETANWAIQAVGQDMGNLLAVLVFWPGVYFLRQGVRAAYFVWLGALMYFIYAYLVYAFAAHFNFLFLVYVAVLGLSVHTFIAGLYTQNLAKVAKPLAQGAANLAAWVLILTGSLFGLLWLNDIVRALLAGTVPQSTLEAGLPVNPIHVIDLSVVLPGMVMAGVWLLRREKLGLILAPSWLVFSVLMGSSIVCTMVLQYVGGSQEAAVPMAMVSVIVIASLLAFVALMAKSPDSQKIRFMS